MKHKYFLTFFLILNSALRAQPVQWEWAISDGTINLDEGKKIAVDAEGSSYVLAKWNDTLYLSWNEAKIIKYDRRGTLLWSKSIKGTFGKVYQGDGSFLNGEDITTDASGNVYVVGEFSGPAYFENLTYTSQAHYGDLFIAKYNAAGSLQWVRQMKGSDSYNSTISSIKVDSAGNYYIVGEPRGNLQLGNVTISGNIALFVAKFDEKGNALWVKSVESSDWGRGGAVSRSLEIDHKGNSYIVGWHEAPYLNFDNISITHQECGSNCYSAKRGTILDPDIFIAKLNSQGNFLWVQQLGKRNQDDVGNDISVDGNDNCFITGCFRVNNGGYSGIHDEGQFFIAKLDQSGAFQWLREDEDSLSSYKGQRQSGSEGYAIATNQNGESFVTGVFVDTLKFDTITVISEGEQNKFIDTYNWGKQDIFLAKYSTDGDVQWVKTAGGLRNESVGDIAIDNDHNCYLTGYINEFHYIKDTIPPFNAVFGPYSLLSEGRTDLFVAKINDAGRHKKDQQIIFTAIKDQHFSDSLCLLSCSADSKLPVKLEVISGPAFISGNQLFFTGLGKVTVRASQMGDSIYFPAINIQQTFEIYEFDRNVPFSMEIFALYPVPTENILILHLKLNQQVNIHFKLVNSIGMTIKEDTETNVVRKYYKELDLTNMQAGMYFFIIEAEGKQIIRRVIKI
jgi:hypothetical protein